MDFRDNPKDLFSWKPTPANTRSERRFSVSSTLIKASLRYAVANDLGQVSLAGELTVTGGLLRSAVRFDVVSAVYSEGLERAKLQHEIVRGKIKTEGSIDWDDRSAVSALHLPFLVEELVRAEVEAFEFSFFDGKKRRQAAFKLWNSTTARLHIGRTPVHISLKDCRIQDFEFQLLGLGALKFRAQE